GSRLFPLLDVAEDLVELGLIDLRSLHRLGIERVADLAVLRTLDQPLDELGVDLLFDEDPAARTAALPLIEEQTELRAGDGGVEIGVSNDDVRALAPQFEGEPL